MSALRARAEEYLAMPRTLGFKLTTQGRHLMSFIRFCEERAADRVIADLAVEWATRTSRGSDSEAYQARRLDVVRIFARHLRALDPATEIPPDDVLSRRQWRIPPCLYSPAEVTALISAAGGLNARLAAIHSLFKYAAPRAPEHAAVISQVLAIPPRRRERAIAGYLTCEEADALIAAPDRRTWHGRRDHALLLLAVQTGLRVSELTGLARQDVHLGAGPHVRCHGKGRKDRATPLTSQTITVLRTWLADLSPSPDSPLFPGRTSGRLSRDAVEMLVAKHAATAEAACPSIKEKNVTPHTLRHYVDGRVMWPEAAFPLVAEPHVLVPAT